MTPERHQQICDLLYRALEVSADERKAFLDRECLSDTSLRQEVESFLQSSADVRSSFLRSSTLRLTLEPGTRIGDYEVESLLGAGGMGEVYRARDVRLGRGVAVKVLSAYLSSEPKQLSRFEQEARAAAALNHPNILAVFQLGEHNSVPYLVSELLEGETLRERIRRERVSQRESIDFAIQIANGLTAAHEKGIVHRDLKPENLFITRDGRVKILDFGLAKLTTSPFGIQLDLKKPGQQDLATEPGMVVGTVGYMSPEQARGQAADGRSDIFALGAVLYEMLSGTRAFHGDSAADTISAILNRQPPSISTAGSKDPVALQRVVQRCLEKAPERRFQSASELARQLEALPRRRSPAVFTVAALAVAALLVAALIFILRSGGLRDLAGRILHRGPSSSLSRKVTERNLTANAPDNPVRSAAISRDGKYVAYTDNSRKVTLLLVDTGDVRQLSLDSFYEPVDWFPDGVHLLVQRTLGQAGLWTFSTWDSSLHKVWDGPARDVAISPDGLKIALIKSPEHREIWVVGTGGEEPHKFLEFDAQDSLWDIAWSPTGSRIAYTRVHGTFDQHTATIESADVGGKGARTTVISEARILGPDGIAGLRWLSDGRIIYGVSTGADEQNLFAIPTNPASGERIGEPRTLTDWKGYFAWGVQLSADGKQLITLKRHTENGIYIEDLASKTHSGARRLLEDRWQNLATAWSTDSNSILLFSKRNGRSAIYKFDLNENKLETLVAGPENYRDPIVSPNGWLFYSVYASPGLPVAAGNWRLMSTPMAGGARSVLMAGRYSYRCGTVQSSGCIVAELRDHQLIFFNLDAAKGKGEEIARISDYAAQEPYWSLSPDAKKIAVGKADAKNGEVEILNLETHKLASLLVQNWRWQEFTSIAWAADGKKLFTIAVSPSSWALVAIAPDGQSKILYDADPDQAWLGMPVASPDGRFLAFTKRAYVSDLVMLEEF